MSSPFFHAQDAKAGNIKRIRWGEIAATLIVVASGASVSYRTGDPQFFWISVFICVVFVSGYEYMLAHPSSEDAA